MSDTLYQPFRTHIATGTSQAISSGIECFKLDTRPSDYVRSRTVTASQGDFSSMLRDLTSLGDFWLPAAAECLDLSPSLDDYVLAITVSMPSDLPNRNGIAFPLEALTEWHPEHGMPMFETWKGKPVCYEHQNDVASSTELAKGIILDCQMSRMENTAGDIWKVVKLLAIDRNKDRLLADDIIEGRRTHYSMGARVRAFTCSICGSDTSDTACAHLPAGSSGPIRDFGGELAFKNTVYPVGFECSSVEVPAFYSASDSPLVASS